MERNEALSLIRSYVKNENSIKHMLATETIMTALAIKFSEDEKKWGLAGLLHDLDMEIVDCVNEPEKHGIETVKILKARGIDNSILEAIKAHNYATDKVPETLMEKSIYCTDPLTGLIAASVLVLPSRKISDLTASSVLKRFKEKAFARGANREIIMTCSEIGLDLEDFIEIGFNAMKNIHEELGF